MYERSPSDRDGIRAEAGLIDWDRCANTDTVADVQARTAAASRED